MVDEDKTIDVLIEEYKIVREGIKDRLATIEKLLGWGITSITITFTAGFYYNICEVFLFIPVLILWFYAILIYEYSEIFVFAGYTKHLEGKINNYCHDFCLKYESFLAKGIYKKYANIPNQVIGYLVSCILIVICLINIYENFPEIFVIYISVYTFLGISIIVGRFIMFSYKEKTCIEANKIDSEQIIE
ncbi:MAG: hypothetical protein ACOWWH_03910 [Eubacteriaceae bacterium]